MHMLYKSSFYISCYVFFRVSVTNGGRFVNETIERKIVFVCCMYINQAPAFLCNKNSYKNKQYTQKFRMVENTNLYKSQYKFLTLCISLRNCQ
ncbi:hypothetical protein V1477_004736 [Vespula maculifrons]|uniref:Secreted protein n=1 Tax=Vespula maculifrons TaxID=7453 RepID=A0ABD2CMN3_VESMC